MQTVMLSVPVFGARPFMDSTDPELFNLALLQLRKTFPKATLVEYKRLQGELRSGAFFKLDDRDREAGEEIILLLGSNGYRLLSAVHIDGSNTAEYISYCFVKD